MTIIQGLHGTIAIVLICVLLYVEETGIPLPLVPGDALLISAGVLIANDSISPWAFFPAAFVAVLGGMLTAYTWSRAVGAPAVEGIAARLRAKGALQRASRWLQGSGPLRIMAARLVPGTRVYTAIVSGTAKIPLPTLLLGGVPAIIVWLAVFTLLGIAVGVPALASLSHVQHLAVTGIVLLVIGLGTLLAIRRIPAAAPSPTVTSHVPRPVLTAASVLTDVIITASVVSGITELLHDGLGLDDPDGIIDLALVCAVIVLTYTAVARQVIGATAGERLLGIRYFAS